MKDGDGASIGYSGSRLWWLEFGITPNGSYATLVDHDIGNIGSMSITVGDCKLGGSPPTKHKGPLFSGF